MNTVTTASTHVSQVDRFMQNDKGLRVKVSGVEATAILLVMFLKICYVAFSTSHVCEDCAL